MTKKHTKENENNEVVYVKRVKRLRLKKLHIYVNFYKRIIICSFFLIISLICCFYSTLKSFSYNAEKTASYKETSNIDYDFYLKKDSLYEKKVLSKKDNIIPIANAIDKINVKFNYNFEMDEAFNIDFLYNIIGTVMILDETGNKKHYEKTYVLKNNTTIQKLNSKNCDITENVEIDYEYYNKIANEFKSYYGIDATSKLVVQFKINKLNSNETDEIKINDSNNMTVNIPLSEKDIDLKMTYKDINTDSKVYKESSIIMNDVIYIIATFISFTISILLIIKLFNYISKTFSKKSIYDEYIKRKLIEYDRLIVETESAPDFNNSNIIKINKFEELLDVRDNLKLPILYYIVVKHQKSYFYIKNEKDTYLLTIKAVDLEK